MGAYVGQKEGFVRKTLQNKCEAEHVRYREKEIRKKRSLNESFSI